MVLSEQSTSESLLSRALRSSRTPDKEKPSLNSKNTRADMDSILETPENEDGVETLQKRVAVATIDSGSTPGENDDVTDSIKNSESETDSPACGSVYGHESVSESSEDSREEWYESEDEQDRSQCAANRRILKEAESILQGGTLLKDQETSLRVLFTEAEDAERDGDCWAPIWTTLGRYAGCEIGSLGKGNQRG